MKACEPQPRSTSSGRPRSLNQPSSRPASVSFSTPSTTWTGWPDDAVGPVDGAQPRPGRLGAIEGL
jgi:hypothetical protein